MNRPRRGKARRPFAPDARPVARTARLGELVREIVADELRRIDDERLEFVTITAVDVDAELNRAIVFFDSLRGAAGDAEVTEAMAGHRVRLQAALGRQMRARKTPLLQFRADEVIRTAERIEEILRTNPPPATDAGDPTGERDVDDGRG